ncbi:coproporphyrinogen III oxidase [Alkalinema sp. FACHB-956]|nr:radical SAM family heme chaperone HemW [Alkalinema sp. FACHB-956]MBD2325526.1 coproporphyrinogen III oxidase [Alkalinema sp. FACHB-956]
MHNDAITAAYLHIPFCRRRCYYCDFPISVVGDRKTGHNSGMIQEYVDKLCGEIRGTTQRSTQPCQTQPYQTQPFPTQLQTIFFGGGTPSLLTPQQLDRLLTTLNQTFGIAPGAEISIEIDPGTFDRAQLQGYRSAGITRVSLGSQAFQPELLQVCGRTHQVEDIYHSAELIHEVGITNYSLDLISGLPSQTVQQWQASLEAAIDLRPTHISTYDLTLEPGTVFGKRYQPGDRPLPTDETTADMYRLASRTLQAAGYEHYEISNYAQPGYACRHNLTYWENRSFYGFGMGATSYVNGQRFARPRTREAYYQWLENPEIPSELLASEIDHTSDRLVETLMVGLRLAKGVAIENLRQQFGNSAIEQVWQCLKRYQAPGWVEAWDATGKRLPPDVSWEEIDRMSLSEPEGFLFSNVVLVSLFEAFGT